MLMSCVAVITAPSFTGIPQAFMHHLEEMIVLHCSCYSFFVVELLVDCDNNKCEREREDMCDYSVYDAFVIWYQSSGVYKVNALLTRILTLMRAWFHSYINLEPIR